MLLQDGPHLFRDGNQFFHYPMILFFRKCTFFSPQRQSQQGEHGNLSCKGFRRSHSDFGAHMDIGTGIRSTGNGRTDDVTDTIDKGSLRLSQFNGS